MVVLKSCICVYFRAELKALGELIEANLSAAELKVKQKRQEELAKMRLSMFKIILSVILSNNKW